MPIQPRLDIGWENMPPYPLPEVAMTQGQGLVSTWCLGVIIRKTRFRAFIGNDNLEGLSFTNLLDLPPRAPFIGIPSLKPSCGGFPTISPNLDFLHNAIRTLKGAKSLSAFTFGFEFRGVFHPAGEGVF
jgi:hypothetical protein